MHDQGQARNTTDEVQQELRELMLFVARPSSETTGTRRECSIQAEDKAGRVPPSDACLPQGKKQTSIAARERLERRRSRQLIKPQSPIVMASGIVRTRIAIRKIGVCRLLARALTLEGLPGTGLPKEEMPELEALTIDALLARDEVPPEGLIVVL